MDGQTIFAVLIGAALACFSLVMVGYAFFRGNEPAPAESTTVDAPADDSVGLDSILDSIDTLELEYQLGNVPEDQYREMLQSYRLQAAHAIRALLRSGNAPRELVLEQEVLDARAATASRESERDWIACPKCDAPLPEAAEADSTCPHCGAALAAASSEMSEGEAPGPVPEAPSQAPVR